MPWPFAQQVWDDACDVGFYVESHITGFRKLFLLTFVQKDHEGDVQHWIYQEYLQPGHVKPGTLITLTIFND